MDRQALPCLRNNCAIAQHRPRRKDLGGHPVLFRTVGDYLIIYRADHRPIEIVAVTQGSRDIPAFLRRRLP
jgi:plasmid stabilization system protein ParE